MTYIQCLIINNPVWLTQKIPMSQFKSATLIHPDLPAESLGLASKFLWVPQQETWWLTECALCIVHTCLGVLGIPKSSPCQLLAACMPCYHWSTQMILHQPRNHPTTSRQHLPLGFSLTDFAFETSVSKNTAYISDVYIKAQKVNKGSDWKKDGRVNNHFLTF